MTTLRRRSTIDVGRRHVELERERSDETPRAMESRDGITRWNESRDGMNHAME